MRVENKETEAYKNGFRSHSVDNLVYWDLLRYTKLEGEKIVQVVQLKKLF